MLYRPGSSASSLLFHTLSLFLSLTLACYLFSLFRSLFLFLSRSCCILLLFTIISSGRILLCIFLSSILLFLLLSLLSSFFFIVNTSTRTFSLFHSLIKIFIHTAELSRLASISFCHLSVVNIIPKVTSWKPISLTLNCSSLVNNSVFFVTVVYNVYVMCLSLCVCLCVYMRVYVLPSRSFNGAILVWKHVPFHADDTWSLSYSSSCTSFNYILSFSRSLVLSRSYTFSQHSLCLLVAKYHLLSSIYCWIKRIKTLASQFIVRKNLIRYVM